MRDEAIRQAAGLSRFVRECSLPDLTITALPKEERDRSLGRYMDAFSRLEGMMRVAAEILLRIDQGAAGLIFATLGTKQLVDLLSASAKLALTDEGVSRVKNICERIGRRNMRRNHIVHGYWTTLIRLEDGAAHAEWVRRYDLVDPARMQLDPTDPKLLGTYNFTIAALDRATDHVEEMVQAMSVLVSDIPTLQFPQPSPAETFRNWEADLQKSRAAITRPRVQYHFP